MKKVEFGDSLAKILIAIGYLVERIEDNLAKIRCFTFEFVRLLYRAVTVLHRNVTAEHLSLVNTMTNIYEEASDRKKQARWTTESLERRIKIAKIRIACMFIDWYFSDGCDFSFASFNNKILDGKGKTLTFSPMYLILVAFHWQSSINCHFANFYKMIKQSFVSHLYIHALKWFAQYKGIRRRISDNSSKIPNTVRRIRDFILMIENRLLQKKLTALEISNEEIAVMLNPHQHMKKHTFKRDWFQ